MSVSLSAKSSALFGYLAFNESAKSRTAGGGGYTVFISVVS